MRFGVRFRNLAAAGVFLLVVPESVSAVANFTRLDCNDSLGSASCHPWTSTVSSASIISSKVTIPCGQCVQMNAAGPELSLDGGLDIQGKLVFLDGYKIHIKTPFVIVQGELHMTATKQVDGTEDVKITLVGTNDNRFRPAANNANNCEGDCTIGIKPFIVAGGQLFINGLCPDTPTWTKLYDITSTSERSAVTPVYPKYHAPVAGGGCPADGVFIKETFLDTNAIMSSTNYHVQGTLGSQYFFTGNSLCVFNRNSERQAPIIDLMNIRHCLEPNVEYILTARVKLTDSNDPSTDKATQCDSSGNGCLHIHYMYTEYDKRVQEKWIYQERPTHGNRNGKTFTISLIVAFSDTELDAAHLDEAIRLLGPSPHIDIELFEFTLQLPPPEAFNTDDDVCTNLAPPNGDAELDSWAAFPYQAYGYQVDLSVDQDGNAQNPTRYFKIGSRSDPWETLYWTVPIGCMQAFSQYEISFDARIHGVAPTIEPYLRIIRSDESQYVRLASCNLSNGNWIKCSSTYTVPSDLLQGNEERFEIYFSIPGDKTTNIDFDNISFASSGDPTNTIVVSNDIQGKWAPGAEVLITSHTTSWQDDQVRKIVGVSNGPTGFTKLVLDSVIRNPITAVDNPIYASEVALLSRNIVIEGFKESGTQALIGAHMMILQTPKIPQLIEGLEVRNGGQQGTIGRYPIHFHFCHDSPGSVLRKNLIRASNQRCVVIHATDMTLVESNIAYDTHGHCFVTEDGMERFNKFHYNLGARTQRVTKIIPNNGSNGNESDDRPATFWIANPTNDYVGNVAAGSETSGFWFELRTSVRGISTNLFEFNPRIMSIGDFRDNVAHSNADKGFRTYPFGYIPDEKAALVNSLAFRNGNHGLFFHESKNLAVIGGHFADNRIGVDFDRVDYVDLDGAVFVGESSEYKNVRLSQGTGKICRSDEEITGIELHSFSTSPDHYGLQCNIKNVEMKGFDPVSTECSKSVAVNLDEEVNWKTADYFTSFEGVRIDDESPRFNFCNPISEGITDIYIVDLNSGFKPAGSSASGVSIAITNDAKLKTMIPNSSRNCVDDDARCASYCQNTCLRTVTYFVDPTAGNYTLRVCDTSNSFRCVDDAGSFYYDADPNEIADNTRNYDRNRFRIYAAHLPGGNFEAKFIGGRNNLAWPIMVREQYEVDMCQGANGLRVGDVRLSKPAADQSQCANLIRNGDAEASNTNPEFWRTYYAGVKVEVGMGMDGSNALGTLARSSSFDSISQFIDTRCMSWAVGKVYEIKAYVKLANVDRSQFFCDPSAAASCPSASIGYYDRNDEYVEIYDVANIRADLSRSDGYQFMQGFFTVPPEVAASYNVEIRFKRNCSDKWMFLDGISMQLVTDASKFQCTDGGNLVLNGDFERGDSLHWEDRNAEGLAIVSPGSGGSGYALRMTKGSARQFIGTDCFDAGERYVVSAKFRLLNEAGSDVACNLYTNAPICPEVHLAFKIGPENYVYNIMYGLGPQIASDWNTILSYVTLTPEQANSESLELFFNRILPGHSLIVDDVVMKLVPQDCSNDIAPFGNGDMGAARLWRNFGPTAVRDYSPGGTSSSGLAIRVSDRSRTWHGAWMDFQQYGDMRCLQTRGQMWELSAQVKLLAAGTNDGASCDTSLTQGGTGRCPKFWVQLIGADKRLMDTVLPGVYTGRWYDNDFNMIKGTFTIPSSNFNAITSAQFAIIDAKEGVDFVIDNVSIRAV